MWGVQGPQGPSKVRHSPGPSAATQQPMLGSGRFLSNMVWLPIGILGGSSQLVTLVSDP